jgi:uncharacterized membrane protein
MSARAEMRSRLAEWRIPALLVLLSLVPALAGTGRLFELARGAAITASNDRFFSSPWPVTMHILSVIPYAIVGAFQFAPALRKRHRRWHRAAGRVLIVLGLVAALTGLWMAQFYPWPVGDGIGVYLERIIFGTGMVLSISLGIAAILRRDYVAHGAWMMRGYAIGLGAGTQVLTHLPWFIFVGQPDEDARTVMMGAGWVINLVVAEWVIWRGRIGSRPRQRSAAQWQWWRGTRRERPVTP